MLLQLYRNMIVIVLIGVIIAGCSWSPEAKKTRHISRGDKFYSEEKYKEAILEYRNALRIDSNDIHAMEHLAFSHYALGEMEQAFRQLFRAKDLDPDNIQVHLKLGTIYLLAKKLDEAKQSADFILTKDKNNLDALILLAGASDTDDEIDQSISRLRNAPASFADQARFHLALANLYLRKKDTLGAEQAFKAAVAKEPNSIEAHTSLANFYVLKRDKENAEIEFKTAAELAPLGSMQRIRLADFYLLIGKPDQAKNILREATEKAPDFLPAWRRMAQLAFAEKDYEESLKTLEPVFKKNPSDVEGKFIRGRIHLAKRQILEAIKEFEEVIKLNPGFLQARSQLALALEQAGDITRAKTELKEALTDDPSSTEAGLLLAELEIKSNNVQAAIDILNRIIGKQPRLPAAFALLGAAHMANKEPAKAAEAFRRSTELSPKNPKGPFLLGGALQAQGKQAEARKQFEAALVLSPDFMEPLVQLITLDMAEKKYEAAIERIRFHRSLTPKAAGLQFLLGKVYLAKADKGQAEAAFLEAVGSDPHQSEAYIALGQLYASSGKDDLALEKLSEAMANNPNAVNILMLAGMIHEKKGDLSRAQEVYEKCLLIDPQFVPAANNLAHLYATHRGDLEKAFQAAAKAHEISPGDPYVNDTMGWIVYQRGFHQWALSLLADSAAKLQDNPEVLYHLGMVHHKLKNTNEAKQTLTKALQLSADFNGAEDARRALQELN